MGDDRNINWKVGVEGAPAAASEVNKLDQSLNKVADTTEKKLNPAFDTSHVKMTKATLAAKPLATQVTGVAAGASALGSTLSRVNPAIGGFASSIGTAGGAVSGLTTAIGGIWGIAAGGLIAALGMAINYVKNYKDEQKLANDATRAGKTAITNYAEALAALNREQEESTRAAELRTGGGPLQQYEVQQRLNKEKIKALETEIEDLEILNQKERVTSDTSKRFDEIRQKEAEIVKLEKESNRIAKARQQMDKEAADRELRNARTQLENQLKGRGAAAGKGVRGGGGRGGGRAAAPETFDWWTGPFETVGEGDEIDRLMQSASTRRDLMTQMIDEVSEHQRRADEDWLAADAEKTRELEANAMQVRQAWFDAASVGPKAALNALYDLAKGYKVNAAKMIESIGDSLWASGMSHVLQAAAMAWIPGMQGNAGGLATAGAAEMATGLVFGAAGAHAGSGGGGAAPARPEPVTGRYTNDEGGGGTVVINVQALEVTHETGMRVKEALDDAQSRRGRAAVPRASL